MWLDNNIEENNVYSGVQHTTTQIILNSNVYSILQLLIILELFYAKVYAVNIQNRRILKAYKRTNSNILITTI